MEQTLEEIFANLGFLTNTNQSVIFESLHEHKLAKDEQNVAEHTSQWMFVEKLISTITNLSTLLKNDNSILISVKNQKLLKSCFQLVTSLGLLPCLIPGVGIGLNKRCENASKLPSIKLDDVGKYTLLKKCTDFFVYSYDIPVLKNIILTSHLADYLAALIQLSYAPLKKPGVYDSFTMTQEMHEKIMTERSKYTSVYETLVSTCFQPMIMKELLVLQSVTNPSPPTFLKKVTSKELSKRLLASGGLLSLIRCFIESQTIDVGQEWKKIDMIKRIVGAKHGNIPEDVYIAIICKQLKEILSSSNIHYYSTAAACIFQLRETYPHNKELQNFSDEIFKCFDLQYLEAMNTPPGGIIFTSQEINHKINILHSFFCVMRLSESVELLSPNMYVLLLMNLKCTKSEELKEKLNSLVLKYLNEIPDDFIVSKLKELLFGNKTKITISIEEHNSGLIIKQILLSVDHPVHDACKYFTEHVKRNVDTKLAGKVFEACLDALISMTEERGKRDSKSLMEVEENSEILDKHDATYGITLQMLEEMCAISQIISSVMKNQENLVKFIEKILLKQNLDSSDECIMIALILLNIFLSGPSNEVLKKRCSVLIPALQRLSLKNAESSFLAGEVLKVLTGLKPAINYKKSQFAKVMSDIFDNLIPVRAHGIIELTRLIEQKDRETISNRHYVLCLFQENLKEEDSYLYLSAINGIAALGKHCTEDVLSVLCKEFLAPSSVCSEVETEEINEKQAQLRMKVGDAIVKVTRSLGEMAVTYKALLLNTILCACKDHDPFVRASALSNLAEVAFVLNYRLDTLLYEVLLCVCSAIESDGAPECRRAAVMVISSLLRGLGKETLVQMEDTLLPVYRTLKKLHFDHNEDEAVRLHAQIALEELKDIVKDFLFQRIDMEKKLVIGDSKIDVKFK